MAVGLSLHLASGIVVVIAVAFTLFGTLFYVMLYLKRVHGYSPVEAGLRIFPLTGLVGLSASIGGAFSRRIARRLQLFAGLLLVAGGMLGLTGLQPNSSFGPMWPWFVVIGGGVGLALVGATRAILGSAPTENAGIAAGIQQTSVQIGAALGTAALGTVVTTRVGDVFRGLLLAHHRPPPLAAKLVIAKSAVTQGIAPVNDQLGAKLIHAVNTASYQTITEGMRMAFISAACTARAIIAPVFVRNPALTGENPVAF